MNEVQRAMCLTYGPSALVREFGPRGAALICAGFAPAGALYSSASPTSGAKPKPGAWFGDISASPAQASYAVSVAMSAADKQKQTELSSPPPPSAVEGTPVGYPRPIVDACIANMRAANVYARAAAILRTEPFASAPQIPVGTRGGVTRYTGAVIPLDLGRIEDVNAPWGPGERARYFISLARHYAAGINDGNARPLNVNPGWGDRILESVPTHDRTAAWVDAWGRWALDAIGIALNDPTTYNAVAAAVLSICRGWEPAVVR